jgi:DNA-binding transcriptional regulator LsrR (DeoR family)
MKRSQSQKRKLTEGDHQTIRIMYFKGVLMKDIAKRFRVHESTISRALNGVKKRKALPRARIVEMYYTTTLTKAQVAAHFKLSTRKVEEILREELRGIP